MVERTARAPMTKSVFYAFNAYVGATTGQYTCSWWPDDPNNYKFDPAFQIPVDLSKTTEAARQGRIAIDDVIVDDFMGFKTGGRTTIGPDFPLGKTVGCCALEANYWDSLSPRIKPGRIPPGFQCREYELTSLYYWDGPLQFRRFFGFHAEIRSTAQNQALVSVFPCGRSLVPGVAPVGTYWLDLARVAHPIDKDCTEIGTAAGSPRTGAVFLDPNTLPPLAF